MRRTRRPLAWAGSVLVLAGGCEERASADPRDAEVPGLCGHGSGLLRDGRLPGIPENGGFVGLDPDDRPPVRGDLDGDASWRLESFERG